MIANNFLLNQVSLNYQATATRLILSRALEQHFAPAIKKQKYVVVGKVMPKCFNWPIPLKDIRCLISKADIISLPILPLNKAKISETINILRCLIECLGLEGIVKDKIVPIKGNYLIVKNMTHTLYQNKSKLNQLMRFSWAEPITGLFHL